MDSKQKARQIVEKEFRRQKRKNKNADYSSDEEVGADTRRKRPLITPSQVRTEDNKVSTGDSKYRDRAQERREGTTQKDDEEDAFDWKEDRRNKESTSVLLKEDPAECAASRFETKEQAQEYLQRNPIPSTVLGKAIIRFWQTRWQKVNPNAPPKLSSSVYIMTTATYPPLQIMPSEKTYPLTSNRGSRPSIPDDLLQQINRACSNAKERCQTVKALTNTSEEPSKNYANEDDDDDDDIFGDLGQYDEQQDEDQLDTRIPTRKGEKVTLFEPEEPEVAPVVIQPEHAQSQRLERFSPAIAEMDYPDDQSSGDEKTHKKKKRKKQRVGSESE